MFVTSGERQILEAIPCTEPADFKELCKSLGDECPDDKTGWAALFRFLDRAEREGLIIQERTKGRMESVILTDEGKNFVRSFR